MKTPIVTPSEMDAHDQLSLKALLRHYVVTCNKHWAVDEDMMALVSTRSLMRLYGKMLINIWRTHPARRRRPPIGLLM